MITREQLLELGFNQGEDIESWQAEDIGRDEHGRTPKDANPVTVGENYIKNIGFIHIGVRFYNGVSKCPYYQGVHMALVGDDYMEIKLLEYGELKTLLSILVFI